MYRRADDGVLHFREAWHDEEFGQLVVNHGTVGHQSTTRETSVASAEAADSLLAAFEAQCSQDGYQIIPVEDQWWVIAQFALKSAEGTERDRYLERKARDALAAYFAWRGIGVVDHTEIDNGRLNIYSLAPDPAKAVAGIKTCIRDARLDYTKLSVGVAPYADPEAVKVKHMPPGSAAFQP
jgi:hypothetical protein